MNKLTTARVIGYGIASIAAITSYGHQAHLLERNEIGSLFGQIPYAYLIPLTVDGLAVIALMVRTDADASVAAKRTALLPLILAGAMSVAANLAEARNVVQFVVGAWTVLAYLLAELLVGKIGGKAATTPVTAAVVPVAPVTPAPVVPVPVTPAPVVAAPVVQAQQVFRQTSATLPVPVSPAPAGMRDRVMVSPLTGRVLMEAPPKA